MKKSYYNNAQTYSLFGAACIMSSAVWTCGLQSVIYYQFKQNSTQIFYNAFLDVWSEIEPANLGKRWQSDVN